MAASSQSHGVDRVTNDDVWGSVKTLFLGSMLLFLVNITLGFLNALTTGGLPRWQMLTHLHAGTIGWITLSVIGVALWVFTGDRNVTEAYARRVRLLVWAGILVFAGYIASFGISFYIAGDAMYLLPVFGTAASLVIWAATIFVLAQLRKQPVLTTTHVLLTGALLVVSTGALMGVLAGLEQAIGTFLPIEPGAIISAHRAPMEVYVFIAGGAILEWLVLHDRAGSWSWPGMILAVLWVIAALAFPIGVFAGFQPATILTFLFGLLLVPLLFVARIAWRAYRETPSRPGMNAWTLFGGLWFAAFAVVFFGVLFALGEEVEWAEAVIFHIFFVGMMTNLLFGVLSAGTVNARRLHRWAEPTANLGLNLGLVVFIALLIGMGSRHGALLMGLGVLVGVGTMAYRLLDPASQGGHGGQPLGTFGD